MHTEGAMTDGAASQTPVPVKRWALLRRIAPALGLIFLSPLTAEYLYGYDTSTGNFIAMFVGLSFFAPLYGGATLIVREVARRTGRGWPTMILLALGFGMIQPGLVDHSLFNPSYRDIDYWQSILNPTYIPALGVSAYLALDFVVGHAIWSVCTPIAIVETFVPYRRTTPWLGKLGLTTTVILYLIASALIFLGHVEEERFLPSARQLIGAAAVIAALIGAAFTVGKRPRPPIDRPAPNPWLVGVAAFVLLSFPSILGFVFKWLSVTPQFKVNWWGVSLGIALTAVLALLIARWSRSEDWSAAHRIALAGGALLTIVWMAFTVTPLGNVPVYLKLTHNTAFALGAVTLLVLAARTARKAQEAKKRCPAPHS